MSILQSTKQSYRTNIILCLWDLGNKQTGEIDIRSNIDMVLEIDTTYNLDRKTTHK